MKHFKQLILLAVAFIMFLVGISIPGRDSPLHIIIVSLAVLIGFDFYLRVFHQVRTLPELTRGERTLWTIAIVCLPVIGNMLFVIIYYSAASRQGHRPGYKA